LPKLEKLVGLFARLERAIDFEALDGQPVDLIFLLLAPETAGADSPQGAGARCAAAARGRRGDQAAPVALTPMRSTPCSRCRPRKPRNARLSIPDWRQ